MSVSNREMKTTAMIKLILQEIRVKQYTKNVLVYAAPLFSGTLLVPDMLYRSTMAFVSFCLIASAVYILNDIMDREKDRQHPTKCHRPIASGKLSLPLAVGIFCALLLLGGGTVMDNSTRADGIASELFRHEYRVLGVSETYRAY